MLYAAEESDVNFHEREVTSTCQILINELNTIVHGE